MDGTSDDVRVHVFVFLRLWFEHFSKVSFISLLLVPMVVLLFCCRGPGSSVSVSWFYILMFSIVRGSAVVSLVHVNFCLLLCHAPCSLCVSTVSCFIVVVLRPVFSVFSFASCLVRSDQSAVSPCYHVFKSSIRSLSFPR